MSDVIWATPLYEFLRQCNATSLEKVVLDCGSGGDNPPLQLFYRSGYRTYGIEIAPDALTLSQQFCRESGVSLNILRGDMRKIPFSNRSFNFVYSFNAIFFMTKLDISFSMLEINRVLNSGGLCFVNFKSVDDPDDRPFCETAPLKHILKSERFAKHEDNEADQYFVDFEILRKEKRIIEKVHGNDRVKQVTIEYIAKKK